MEENKNVSVNDRESQRIWPRDLLGNEIKKNACVAVSFPRQPVIMRVADVEPVHLTAGVNVEGMITLMLQVPHTGECPIFLVLKEPDEGRIVEPTGKIALQ